MKFKCIHTQYTHDYISHILLTINEINSGKRSNSGNGNQKGSCGSWATRLWHSHRPNGRAKWNVFEERQHHQQQQQHWKWAKRECIRIISARISVADKLLTKCFPELILCCVSNNNRTSIIDMVTQFMYMNGGENSLVCKPLVQLGYSTKFIMITLK